MFKKILSVLGSVVSIELLWINYQPEKILNSFQSSTIKNLDLRNYNTANELLKKEKPDLIFISPYESFIDLSFSYAAKSLKIPTAGLIYYQLTSGAKDGVRGFRLWKTYLKRIFSNYVISETEAKTSTFRRGRFILYKFNFFLKTIISTNFSFLKKISIIIFVLKLTLYPLHVFNKKLSLSLHLVQNKNIKKHLMENGVSIDTIKITGNPMFDDFLFDKNNFPKKTISKPINLLLLPLSFQDYGDWTKEQTSKIFKDIVTEISKNTHMILTIKLHPSASNYEQYKNILKTIDPKIKLFKEGSVEKYLHDTDIVITYNSWSTSSWFALFQGIPIVICNFFNFIDDEFLNRKLAIECKSYEDLNYSINEAITNNPATPEKVDQYVNDYFDILDGNSAKRISKEILTFFKK